MVYYGLKLLNPDYFYPTACLICLVVAVSIGSSWTVAGTLGIGLMGVAREMGLDPAITAGAVISGAYFGDKLSPLSGTANLACAAAGADLYDHVRESLWTSGPSLALALGLFWSLGSAAEFDASGVTARIEAAFQPSLLHFLPLALVLVLALLRWPPFVAIFLGALAGGVLAVGGRAGAGHRLRRSGAAGRPRAVSRASGRRCPAATSPPPARPPSTSSSRAAAWRACSRTVWLILVALAFGGFVEKAGRARAPDRAADRGGALGRRAGRDAGRRRLRHQRARLRPVHRRGAARAHVPSALSRRAASPRSCSRARSATPRR